ncbi:hypothetical protein PRZ48_012077 [Zasmidium cellare]|uniref:Uncharacterized protein n=1 Tax=Zasmidium cellare TaxID=395010 RepID=A0ABR0E3U8_ZASCE|nr:hypothetical protein PRZ48_012077 [Zasmidium cellare]
MAIDSESYDTKARIHELHSIEDQSRELMAGMSNASMHPRVLTALMRLWIADWQTTPWKRQMLQVVKGMVCRTSEQLLRASHPIAALSRLVSNHHDPNEVVSAFFEQFQKRWISHAIDEDADFAVREQIYGARVLASIGRPGRAAELLQQTDVRREVTSHTLADFYSTRGYAYLQDKRYRDGIPDLQIAIKTFEAIGDGNSESADRTIRMGVQRRAAKNQGALKLVLDLHRVYQKQDKHEELQRLEERYSAYFEEVPAEPS